MGRIFPLFASFDSTEGCSAIPLGEVAEHLLKGAGCSLLPKPLNSSFKFRQAGLQFRL